MQAGFEVVSLMGEFDGTPWKEDSLEQIGFPETGNEESIFIPKLFPMRGHEECTEENTRWIFLCHQQYL